MPYFTILDSSSGQSRLSKSMATACATIALTAAAMSLSSVTLADDRAAHTSLVSENASFFTPGTVDGRVEAIAVDGDTVFVGGTFTQIQMALDGEIITQPYLFSYSKSTGAINRDFDPILNRPVRALQTTGESTGIFAGGDFTIVNGETNRKGLIKLDNFGDRVQGFSARPDKRVYAMDRSGNTLYLGGNFERIGSQPVEYLAAVDTITGELLPKINLDFEGVISTPRTTGFASVDAVEVTSDDQLMVIIGNFQSINGVSRTRLAVLELGDQTVVSDWNTDVFDVDCPSVRDPQYIEGIDISPDDSYFVTGTTGAGRIGDPACDTILRFDFDDLTDTDAEPTWITYTGGDSVYEVAASEHAVYTGGHFRWLNNAFARDRTGPGALERRGLAALDPLNGLPLVDWQSDRNPRGVGTFALEIQPEGLYIGDDTDFLNGFEHPKFKFLPITTNTITRPNVPSLPTTIFSVNGSGLDAISFDGVILGDPLTVSSTGWSNSRGAMFLDGQLFHADDNGDMWVSSLSDDDTLGPRMPVDLFALTSNEWDLARLGGMFFDHEQGRVYYSLEGDSLLYWRAFTPEGPIFGDTEFIAEEQGDIPWNTVQGMDVVNNHLYFGLNDGNLYRSTIDGSSPVPGTTQTISGPLIDTRSWTGPQLAFYSDSQVLPQIVIPPADAQSCAPENGQCVLPDNVSATVYYGANSSFVALSGLTGTVSCNNATFGDPIVGTFKGCSYVVETLSSVQFESAGSSTFKSFKTFEFPVQPGEQVNVRLTWDDPNAQLNVFLRDANGELLDADRDRSDSASKWLSALAVDGGMYSVAVKIQEGSTAYTVSVNPAEEPPAPLADFEFASSGTADTGSWQVFSFDVEAGETIDAQISWDDPTAQLNLFLRDETNASVDRITDGSGSPGVLSGIAITAGRWSVGVKIKSGAANYDVLVDTNAQ